MQRAEGMRTLPPGTGNPAMPSPGQLGILAYHLLDWVNKDSHPLKMQWPPTQGKMVVKVGFLLLGAINLPRKLKLSNSMK
jgi:hypothetical protein